MILSLEATHKLGYIHRDIKPDNFLFSADGHLRVADFGLATDLHWVGGCLITDTGLAGP